MNDEHDSDEWSVDPPRLALIDWLLAQQGKPYVWGADGPDCFDCSGLVAASLHHFGICDVRATHNARKMFDILEPLEFPQVLPVDLCFYGQPGSQNMHVMFMWSDGRVYGAAGGNSGTTTIEIAEKVGARVRFRNSHLYRPDLRGFRRYPFPHPRPSPPNAA